MNDLMIDIETLGKAPGSVILSIGAVWFDAATGELGDEYYAAINPQSAISSGLCMDVSTVQWWMGQSDEARAAAFSGERILSWALGEFGDFVRKSEAKRIWAKPPSFDLVLLEAAFAACSIPIPWEYWTPRDCRTLFEISNVKQAAFGTKHNALDDAKSQATAVIEAYRVLRLSDPAPEQDVEPTDDLVRCDICAKPLNPDDICATDIELGICHAECLEGSPVVNLDTGEPLPDSELHTYRFGDIENVESRITYLEAALAAEEERSKQLLVRLDKAREGKEPDFCYDPDEWEYTCDWEERDQVHGLGDALSVAEPMQVATLIRGPRKWVAKVPTSWDENGDPDDTEIKWFDSEEAARAALAAPASEGSTGE